MTSSQQARLAARRVTTVLLRAVNHPAWGFALRELPLIFPVAARAARVLLDDFALAIETGRRAPSDGALRPFLETFLDDWVARFADLIDEQDARLEQLDQLAERIADFLESDRLGPPTPGSRWPRDHQDFDASGPPAGGDFPTDP